MFSHKGLLVRIAFLVVAGLLVNLALVPAATVNQDLTLNPVADLYLYASSPSTNHGSMTALRVDPLHVESGDLRFSVTGLGSSGKSRMPSPNSKLAVTSSTSTIKHIFLVVMENHSYSDVWNKSYTPYITKLGKAFARAKKYYATSHPSLPNYLDLFGGSSYGISTDCSPSSSCHINASNLADNLEARGLTWKAYMESMPSNCRITASGEYAPKHNPFVYFDDIRNNTARCNAGVVPYTALANDLGSAASTPNFAFITPNLCDDMHNCSVATGDNWLKLNLKPILKSPACKVDTCLLILTWDEDDGSQANRVLTIFAGSGAKSGGVGSAKVYTHFSLLRTIEDIFSLPTLTSADVNATPMTDLLR